MGLTDIQERILKFCYADSRFTHEIIGFFCRDCYGYKNWEIKSKPQTIRNNLTELIMFGWLKKKRFGRYFKYFVTDKSRDWLLNGTVIVEEIRSRSRNNQLLLNVFMK